MAQGSAASNLSSAMKKQADLADEMNGKSTTTMASAAAETSTTTGDGGADEYQEVTSFLDSINLAKYKDRFIENGIEDEETILELNDTHLDAISVPLGHKLKILKRIKMIRQEKGLSVPESRQG